MAIQNFLSGGYYGKLGDTVGQRWHNKRTIRSYVVPKNPQTEKQQANRNLFATANRLAQEAYNVNKGSELWDTTNKSQFSQMVSTAKLRLQAGMSEADALPLYPDNYDPAVTLSNVALNWSGWYTSMSWTAQSYILPESRRFAITYRDFHTESPGWSISTYYVTFNKGELVNHSFLTYGYRCLPTGAYITVQTVDDEQHGGSSITLPPLQIVQPSRPYFIQHLTFGAPYWIEPEEGVGIPVYNMPTYPDYFLVTDAYLLDIITNRMETTRLEFPRDYPRENIIYISNGDHYQTPTGSKIYAGEYRVETPAAVIICTWEDYNFSYWPWPV
jgi:hypothetical protein